MKQLSDLSIADLKAALDFTSEKIIEVKISETQYPEPHKPKPSKQLEELKERLETTLWFKMRDLMNYE